MKIKIVTALYSLGLVQSVFALTLKMPFSGCTVYEPRMLPHFEMCAEFSSMRGRGGCSKTKGFCPACVTYPGDHLQMWLPDFLVEVTPHLGRSVFAESAAGVGLKAHLGAATSWAMGTSGQVPGISNGTAYDTAHASFWHVRVLPLPYGKFVTTFPPLAPSRGVGIPTCYSALSELSLGQWTYGLADLPATALLAPIAFPSCYSPLGVARTFAPSGIGGPNDEGIASGFPRGCALPVPVKLGLAKNMSAGSDAWNAEKLCIGSFGALLPRTGMVESNDPFKAALIAGVKFASLTGDHFGDTVTGGWELEDKWQLVYPPSPHAYCSKPGHASSALEFPVGVIEDPVTRAQENAVPSSKSGIYIFAVWRKRTSCEEPLDSVSGGTAWRKIYEVNKLKNISLCTSAQVIP